MIEHIKQVKEAYKQEFLNKANVIGVAVGFRFVNNVNTGEICIAVNVTNKLPLENLNAEDIVPPHIEGIITDVIGIGQITAHFDPTQPFRPAPGGVSIGHKDITAGTLGVVVVKKAKSVIPIDESFISINGAILGYPISELTKKDELYILSNNHVLANSNCAEIGDPIYQPGVYDGGTSVDTIAILHSFVPIDFEGINLVDAALARPIDYGDVIPKEILEIGEVSETVEAELGMLVRKYGRTTQYNGGEVIQIHATVDVGGYPNGVARFEEQIITTNMSSGGDSGSLLVELNGQRAVGLLFAGSSSVTVHNRIKNVEDALGIKL